MASNKLIKKLEDRERKLSFRELQDQQDRAECDHKYLKKGTEYTALKQIEGAKKGLCKCRICGERVDTNPMDIDELKEAASKLLNALQCVDAAPNEFDSKARESIRQLKLAVQKIPLIYKHNFIANEEVQSVDDIDDNDYNSNGAMYIKGNDKPFGGFGNFGKNGKYKGGKDKNHKNKNKNKNHKKKKHYDDRDRGTTIWDMR